MTRSRIPAAIAAVSAAAGLTLVASPAASADTPTTSAVQPTPTVGSLSIRAVRSVVRPGHPAVIDGSLAAPNTSVAGKTVTLQEMASGTTAWSAVATATTRDFGGATASVPVTGPTRFRWVFDGDGTITAATSGVVLVRTSTRAHDFSRFPSSLSIRLVSPHRASGHALVAGTLRGHGSRLPHEQVLLMIRRADAPWWSVTRARPTNGNGRVAFVVDPPAGAAYRLAFLGDQQFRPTESGVVRASSTAALSIWRTPAQIDPNTPATVGGELTVDGAPVAGRAVNLLGHDVHTRYGWKIVGRGITDATGSVAFVVTPRETMRYRLVAPGSAGVPAATSTTAVVAVRTPTALRITGTTVTAGYAVSGRLVSRGYAVAGQAVILQQRQSDGTWTSLGSRLTDGNGRVRFVESPMSGATYQLLFVGTGTWATSTSPTVTQP